MLDGASPPLLRTPYTLETLYGVRRQPDARDTICVARPTAAACMETVTLYQRPLPWVGMLALLRCSVVSLVRICPRPYHLRTRRPRFEASGLLWQLFVDSSSRRLIADGHDRSRLATNIGAIQSFSVYFTQRGRLEAAASRCLGTGKIPTRRSLPWKRCALRRIPRKRDSLCHAETKAAPAAAQNLIPQGRDKVCDIGQSRGSTCVQA